MNIIIFSKDEFLFSFIKNNIDNINVEMYLEPFCELDFNNYHIFILDLVEKENIDYIINRINTNFSLIININNFKLNDAINIGLPFKINTLKDHIETYIDYTKKYYIIDNKFKLNINKNVLLINNKNIQLTEKECLLLKILYQEKKIYKDDLLKIVCGYDNGRAIETIIYNIRFKLKNSGMENFIICQDGGYYKLNLL